MSLSQQQGSTSNSSSMVFMLTTIFGVGNGTVMANHKPDGEVTFTDDDTKNIWTTKLPPGVVFFGPGLYKITIHEDSFEFEEIKENAE